MSTFRLPTGAVIREPQAVTDFRVGVALRAAALESGRVMLLATSERGEDVYATGGLGVHEFSTYAEAEDLLASGNALRYIDLLFNPSPHFPGASTVVFLRTQDTTKASYVVQDAVGGTAFTVNAKSGGTWGNSIRIDVDTVAAPTFVISIHYDTDGLGGAPDAGELVEVITVPAATNALIVAAINSANTGSSLVDAVLGPDAIADSTAGYQNLATGANGTFAAALSTALTLAQTIEKKIVVAETVAAVDHGTIASHCLNDSESRCFGVFGQTTGVTLAAAITAAGNLNSAKAVFAWPGIQMYTTDATGNVETLDASYRAAMVAGLTAGLRPGRPITRKTLRILGNEVLADFPLSQTERNQALDAGVVTTIEKRNRGFVILHGLTSLQANDAIYDPSTNMTSEISLEHATNVLMDELENGLDSTFIGEDKAEYPAAIIEAFTRDYLSSAVERKIIVDFSSIVVVDVADRYEVSFNINGNNPINFIYALGTAVS